MARPGGPGGHGGGPGGRFGKPVEKAKDFKGTGKRLLSYFKPYKIHFFIIVLFAIISEIFYLVSPIMLGKITDSLFDSYVNKIGVNFNFVFKVLSVLAFVYVLRSLFKFIQEKITAKMSQEIIYDMRKTMDKKICKLPMGYFDSKTKGEILSRFTNDVDTVGSSMQQILNQIISAVITLVGILAIMLSISVRLTIVTLITVPLSLVVVIFISKFSQKYFREQQKIIGDLNSHVEEMISGQNIIKAFNYEDTSKKEFNEINDKLYTNSIKAQFISSLIMPATKIIGNLSYVVICLLGGVMAVKKTITVGDIQAFIMYSKQFNHPITQTAQLASVLQSTVAAAERVFEFLDEKEKPVNGNEIIEKTQGKVEFKNVDFSYDKSKELIKDLNLTANKGDIIAIVGNTGAGKTTLVNLLMGFYRVDNGEILIDGTNINDIEKDNLYSMLGMVLQDTWLFNGTIYDNIAYGVENATREDVINASKMAKADGFIKRMPLGYETMINEEASNLSVGQKQLITIARAILKNPDILILDEATSSVDTRTETLIQKAMENLMQGRTSFMIAHRLSTIKNASCILVMEKGRIIEKGTHNELLKVDGHYAKLYNSQFAK